MRLASKRSSESDSHKKVRKRDMLLKFRVNERSTHPDSKQPKQLELLRFWTWQVLAISLTVVSPDDIPTWHLRKLLSVPTAYNQNCSVFFLPFLTSWVTLHLSDRLLSMVISGVKKSESRLPFCQIWGCQERFSPRKKAIVVSGVHVYVCI